jgi:general secretion pathway protein L
MERETDLLRAAAGKPGSGDLETLMAAVSSAWPDAQGPMQNLRFQTGQLSLSAAGWSAADIRQFSERLQPAGWTVNAQGGRVVVTRKAP